jgi:hypothetical protein
MSERTSPRFGDGFEAGTAVVGHLVDRYGAEIVGYDVDPGGEVVIDVRLHGSHPSVRAIRISETASRAEARSRSAYLRRQWGLRVASHTRTIRDLLAALRGRGEPTV